MDLIGEVAEQDIVIAQGSKFEMTVVVTEGGVVKNITGWSARMQIRPARGSSTLYDDFSSPADSLTISGVDGQVLVDIPGSITAAYDWTNGAYDIKLTDTGGEPHRIVEGTVKVDHSVTE
jgi:hypothetical protein